MTSKRSEASPNTWTKADIRRARQVALRPILEDLGYQFTELHNGNYRVHHLAGEIVAKDHFWVCKNPDQSGNAIDFLVEIQGMSFSQAVKLLLSYSTAKRTTTTQI
jgi:hypothetical protein